MSTTRTNWKPIIPYAATVVNGYATGDHPTHVTLRQLFYRLVSEPLDSPYRIRNNRGAYSRLSELTAEARRERTFPALLDMTRTITEEPAWTDAAEALRAIASQYRIDRTQGQEVQIWLGVRSPPWSLRSHHGSATSARPSSPCVATGRRLWPIR